MKKVDIRKMTDQIVDRDTINERIRFAATHESDSVLKSLSNQLLSMYMLELIENVNYICKIVITDTVHMKTDGAKGLVRLD